MTPKRKEYLAKCSEREKEIRMLIKYYKYELKKAKAVCSSYDLKKIGRKPFGYRVHIGTVEQCKVIISALYHELARFKGMDRVVVPRAVTIPPNTDLKQGDCICGREVYDALDNYCPNCGRKILWKKVT